jgi:hypothetical protein
LADASVFILGVEPLLEYITERFEVQKGGQIFLKEPTHLDRNTGGYGDSSRRAVIADIRVRLSQRL